ncbi:non-specific lipid transfer protein GPI-anchored 31 [Nicotiana tabacum]|uniref:Non-specific lipid transfer protein GPI-anchored 31 n=1 Tax=Nicotiana tabacum TaxID=4097 RepID=A0A1S4DQD9_TOBAC|nr:PREDICTED: non-specific lipid-transfer protein-like protein At2g13820 [Nicotiana tabacum]
MASKMNSFALFCLVLMWAFSSTTVESASRQAAPAPAVDCNNLVLNLADCLSFVTNGSTEKKPQGTCCSGLKMVLKTDAECLCEGFKNSAQLGVVLNVTKAMALPAACHVSAPSVSNCGLTTDTGAAPALSPIAVSPTTSAAVAPTIAEGASEVAPAPAPGSSDSTTLGLSIGQLVLTVMAVAFSWF